MIKKLNRKGFTLVEILVTMVILGIVTAMAFPVLKTVSENNTEKKYKAFSKSLESAAKLYVDSYSNDLFSGEKTGSSCIYFNQMHTKLLTKDIEDNDISCNSSKTFVIVKKLDDVYKYEVHLGCGKKQSNGAETEATIFYPKTQDSSISCESVNNSNNYTFTLDPEKYEGNDKQSLRINVTLSSETGVNKQSSRILYAWTENPNEVNSLNWNQFNFDFPTVKKQQQLLESSNNKITATSIIKTPSQTGIWYLKIKYESLQNVYNQSLLKETEYNKIDTYGSYKIDKDKPVINSVQVSSRENGFNSKKIKVIINATDNDRFTEFSKLQYCIGTDKNSCTTYSSNYTQDYELNGKYDGSTKKIYGWVRDQAGNISTSSVDYVLYTECIGKNVQSNGKWQDISSCSKKCGTGTKNQKSGSIDKYTKNACSREFTQSVKCNTFACCSNGHIRYVDGNSCSSSCGYGTKNRIAYSSYDNSRCPGYDSGSGGSECNTFACCSNGHIRYVDGNNCSSSCGYGTKNRIAYSSYDNSRCPGYDSSSGGSGCKIRDCYVPNSCNYVGNTLKHASDYRQIQWYGNCPGDRNQYLHLCTDGNGNLYHPKTGQSAFQYFCPSNNLNRYQAGSIFWFGSTPYTVVDDSRILWKYFDYHFT